MTTFKQHLNEAVDTGSGKVSNANVYLEDDGGVVISARGLANPVNLDIDKAMIQRLYTASRIKVAAFIGAGMVSRQTSVTLTLADDDSLCIKGLIPGKELCLDIYKDDLMNVLKGTPMRNVMVWTS